MESDEFDLDPTWRALSDPTRRRILDELREGPRNTSALCGLFDQISRHGVIKHLKVLEAAGLVRVEAVGRERINHLNPVPLQQIYERWLRPFEMFGATSLYRIAQTAEQAEKSTTEQANKTTAEQAERSKEKKAK